MLLGVIQGKTQIFEIQNDAKMKRTRQRPLPSGRITVPHAALWASTAGIAGTSLLAWQVNYLAAGLAACNLVLGSEQLVQFPCYSGGLTSLWFTLESSLLTLCLSIGAVMFVRESTAKNAWRLPNDNQETMLVNSSILEGLLISYPQEYDYESSSHQERRIRNANSCHGRAPVAYTSVAPFPFLHAPMYVSPDSWV